MGMDSDAILFYGYVWGEGEGPFTPRYDEDDYDEGDSDEDKWAESLARASGAKNPWDSYVEPPRHLSYDEREAISKSWIAEHDEALDVWYEAKHAIEKKWAVRIGTHCSYEVLMKYLTVEGAEIRTCWGDFSIVDPVEMMAKPTDEWNDRFIRWAEATGANLEDAEGPGWFLVSMYG